ncbi:MAG: PAS domain-containing protein [Pontiellaceae bacterium]|nr:PAS domain-containing protein [Pontiellaceae bacterium]MBN2783364.1 PAS domain-containing protein [Pontiellaceae bacterium]
MKAWCGKEKSLTTDGYVWPSWIKTTGSIILVLLLTAIGLWGVFESGKRAEQHLRRKLLRETIVIADAIPSEEAALLTFTEADRELPAFQRISEQLKAYAQLKNLRCLYTMALKDGQLVFGPESMDADDPLASSPGTIYENPHPSDYDAFKTAEPVIIGPCKDEYGPYYSIAAPVLHPDTGSVMMTVGIDINPEQWKAVIEQSRQIPVIILVTALVTLLVTILIARVRRQFPEKRAHTLHYSEAIACATIMIILTIGVSMLIHQMDKNNRDELFALTTNLKTKAYNVELQRIRDELQSLVVFYESSDYISPAEFSDFSLGIVRSPVITGCAWVPKTADSTGSEAYCIQYIEPMEGNEALKGQNLQEDEHLRASIYTSQQSGLPIAAPSAEKHELYLFMPIHKQPQEGVVTLMIDPLRLVTKVGLQSSLQSSYLSTTLMEVNPDGKAAILACNRTACTHECPSVLSENLHAISPLFAFGKTYALLISPEHEWYALHPLGNHSVAMFCGIILSLIGTGTTFTLANRPVLLESLLRKGNETLIRSEERFELAVAAAGIGVWEWDITKQHIIWDRQMFRMYGISPDRFDGSHEAWIRFLHPDDKQRVREESMAAIENETRMDFTFRICRNDGRIRHIRTVGMVSHPEPGQSRMIGVNLDVTESRTKEEQILTQLDELNRWQSVTMNREDRIIALKREVNQLLKSLNESPRYSIELINADDEIEE